MKAHPALARLGCWIWIALVLASCGIPAPAGSADLPEYWPTTGWRTSTPEQQGIDSAKLADMLAEIQDRQYSIHGLLVVRNGYLVLEMYTPPFHAASRHYVASATKSFTSALIGIAIDKGAIDGLDAPLLEFFPGRDFANPDPRKQEIRLEHLLSMSSGIDWPAQGLYEPLGNQLRTASDGVQMMLDRPMAYRPGEQFNYNTGGSLLLSAVLAQSTGKSALAYAQENIFTPLGISDVLWTPDSQGILPGGSGLELTPRDMAKFGYLYLKNGEWDGQAIISPEWVKTSTTAQIETGFILDLAYGYHWWVHPSGVYHARGYGGQRIFVLPDRQMVVVFTGGFSGEDMETVPDSLLDTYIIPAARREGALRANRDEEGRLADLVSALAEVKPKPAGPLPETAKRISGQMYDIEPNSLGITRMSWDFSGEEARGGVTFGEGSHMQMSLGLDDVYRATRIELPGSPAMTFYSKGTWVSDDTLILYAMRDGNNVQMKVVFREEGLEVTFYTGGPGETVSGRLSPDP